MALAGSGTQAQLPGGEGGGGQQACQTAGGAVPARCRPGSPVAQEPTLSLPGNRGLALPRFSLAGNPSPWGPGVLFCLVFSTSHQSDDSARVASGMEMFKL